MTPQFTIVELLLLYHLRIVEKHPKIEQNSRVMTLIFPRNSITFELIKKIWVVRSRHFNIHMIVNSKTKRGPFSL